MTADKAADFHAEGFDIRRLWADSASVFTRLGIDDSNIYFGTSTGMVKAIDKNSGAMLWQTHVGGSLYSRPVPLGNNLLAVPYNSGLRIVDTSGGNTVKVFNENFFKNLDNVKLNWTLLRNGQPTRSGSIDRLDIAPQAKRDYTIDFGPVDNSAEWLLNIDYTLKNAEPMLPAGFTIAREQLALTAPVAPVATTQTGDAPKSPTTTGR